MKITLLSFGIIVVLFDICWIIWMLFGGGIHIIPTTSSLKVSSYANTHLSSMSLKQKVSSLLILHTPGTDATSLKDYLSMYQPGGLIFMSDNIPETDSQLRALTSAINNNLTLPYLLAVDGEGGVVNRLPSDTFPAALYLRDAPVSETLNAFRRRSELLRNSGFNLNFGIVADVTNDPNSFIYPRVFGGDHKSAGDRVAAAVTASKGLTLSTLKHFPGHGESKADSHLSIPTTDISLSQWESRDKLPFQMGIDAGANVVMFGHLRYSGIDDEPASLSIKWHDILKSQLGFNGISVTDDMMMLQNSGDEQYSDPTTNAIKALQAGNTMLLYVLGPDNSVSEVSIDDLIDEIVTAVKDGRLKLGVINNNARKVINVRRSLFKFASL